jgi:hypothetical protein
MSLCRNKVTVAFMAIAILLPNCPCKLLSLFGVEVKGGVTSSAWNQNTAEIAKINVSTFAVVCHCDDEDKTFEGPSNAIQANGITAQLEAWSLWSENDTIGSQISIRNSRQRAPPKIPRNGTQILSRDFLCSYLI